MGGGSREVGVVSLGRGGASVHWMCEHVQAVSNDEERHSAPNRHSEQSVRGGGCEGVRA